MVALYTCIIVAILLRFVIPRFPVCTVDENRWSARKVCTCGGLIFLPFAYLGLMAGHGSGSLLVLGFAVTFYWLLGAVDDFAKLDVKIKLLMQVWFALFLIFGGWTLDWFSNPALNFLSSLLWIVGIVNAFNLLDNMDSLCGGTVLITSTFLFLITGNPLAAVVAGIAGGFLVFNFPKAKIWMGDCGAYFFGTLIACLSMDSTLKGWSILILIVPIVDTTFVTFRRLLKGKSPARGGTDHISHELAKKWGECRALMILFAASFLSGLTVYLIV